MCAAQAPIARLVRLGAFAQFQVVMNQGRVLASSPHFVLHGLSAASTPARAPAASSAPVSASASASVNTPVVAQSLLRYGALLPKRHAKRAVTRNTLRRQMHALAPAWLPQLAQQLQAPQLQTVLRLRKAFDPAEFVSARSSVLKQAVRQELQLLFATALKNAARASQAASGSVAQSA